MRVTHRLGKPDEAPDGKFIVTGAPNGTIVDGELLLWTLEPGEVGVFQAEGQFGYRQWFRKDHGGRWFLFVWDDIFRGACEGRHGMACAIARSEEEAINFICARAGESVREELENNDVKILSVNAPFGTAAYGGE